MNRIVKIAIYVGVLFLVAVWMSTVFKSCNKSAEVTTEETTQVDTELDEFEQDFFEEDLDSEVDYSSDMGSGSTTEEVDFEPNYEEIDRVLDSKTVETTTTSTTTTKTPYNTSRSGKYMVLAGSYLIEGNAKVMMNKLEKLGYDNTEMVVFDMSQYHSVCAARLGNYNDAMQLSKELKRRGIDNYVHTKQ